MKWFVIPLAAGYLALALAGDLRQQPAAWLSLHAALVAVYLVACRRVFKDPGFARTRDLLAAAFLFRAILVPFPPTLSDDLWRYLWEGRVQLHGVNPYALAPSDPSLAPLRDKDWEGINYKDLPAIYPPVSQWANAAGAALGWGHAGVKLIFVCADIALAWLLASLLKARGHPPGRALVYAWNPLAIVEVAGSGHNDPLALCLLLAATLGIIAGRPLLSTLPLGLAGAAKFLPLAFGPLLFGRRAIASMAASAAVTAACFVPYLAAGGFLFFSARQYAERWRGNDSLFTMMERGIALTGISDPLKRLADSRGIDSLYTQPHMLARGLAGAIALGAILLLARRVRSGGMPPERGIFLATGTILLLGPILHPWYLLWILPWLAFYPSPAWFALAALAPLSYLEAGWVRWAEYVPFFGLLLFGGFAARLRPSTARGVIASARGGETTREGGP